MRQAEHINRKDAMYTKHTNYYRKQLQPLLISTKGKYTNLYMRARCTKLACYTPKLASLTQPIYRQAYEMLQTIKLLSLHSTF
jgi:hypothetical protein